MKTSAQMSPAVLMALGMGLMPTRLRQALGAMSSAQRKIIRLPHVGAKEIAKHDRRMLLQVVKMLDAAPVPERSVAEIQAIREAWGTANV